MESQWRRFVRWSAKNNTGEVLVMNLVLALVFTSVGIPLIFYNSDWSALLAVFTPLFIFGAAIFKLYDVNLFFFLLFLFLSPLFVIFGAVMVWGWSYPLLAVEAAYWAVLIGVYIFRFRHIEKKKSLTLRPAQCFVVGISLFVLLGASIVPFVLMITDTTTIGETWGVVGGLAGLGALVAVLFMLMFEKVPLNALRWYLPAGYEYEGISVDQNGNPLSPNN